MSRLIISFSLILLHLCATAQKSEPIQTDRPDQTESPSIVPKGHFQYEVGFATEHLQESDNSISYPAMLFKYGVSEKFELRLIAELTSEKSPEQNVRGVLPLGVGVKISMTEEHGIVPKTSFIGHLFIPELSSKDYRTVFYAPAFRFTMAHTLSDRFSLGYNLGAEWDGFTPEPAFIYTLTTGFKISDKIGSYVELYGFAPQKQSADHRADGGFTYLVNNDMQLDISAGIGITEKSPDHYFSIGFSHRFSTKCRASQNN